MGPKLLKMVQILCFFALLRGQPNIDFKNYIITDIICQKSHASTCIAAMAD